MVAPSAVNAGARKRSRSESQVGAAGQAVSLAYTVPGPRVQQHHQPQPQPEQQEPPSSQWIADTRAQLLKASEDLSRRGHRADSLLAYMAAHRLSRLMLDEKSQSDLSALIAKGKVVNAAATVLSERSSSSTVQDLDAALFKCANVVLGGGVVELCYPNDFVYMFGGADAVAQKRSVRDAIADLETRTDTPHEIRARLFDAVLQRYKRWVERQKTNQPIQPCDDGDDLDYQRIEKLGETSCHQGIVSLLHACQAAAADEVKSFDGFVSARPWFRKLEVLMRDGMNQELETRAVKNVDGTVGFVSTLHHILLAATTTTLVLSGESGSGKTVSMLALATLTDRHICVYLLARDVVCQAAADSVLHLDHLDRSDPRERNAQCAEALVKALVALAPTHLSKPFEVASSAKKTVLIMVDEAGNYPNLVRAMCSPLLTLHAPQGVDVSSATGGRMLLKDFLNVANIQLVVAGTGVDADKQGCGSSPLKYTHVVMNDVSSKVIDALETLLKRQLPWLESFRAARGGGVQCSVLRCIDDLKSNPRMYACFVGQVLQSNVLSGLTMPSEPSPSNTQLEQVMAKATVCDAAYYIELKVCLSRGMVDFRELNALKTVAFEEAMQVMLLGVGYTCLPYDSDVVAPIALQARFGVLVDRAERWIEPVAPTKNRAGNTAPTRSPRAAVETAPSQIAAEGGVSFDPATDKVIPHHDYVGVDATNRKVHVRLVLRQHLHRYTVSRAHAALGLSMLGIRDPMWTRLGFQSIMMDLSYLHCCMAVNSDDSSLEVGRLFNEPSMDPLRLYKAELWTAARKLRIDVDGKASHVVFVVTTTLPMPKRAPTIDGEEETMARVTPTSWLEASLSQRVDEYFRKFFAGSLLNEVKMIVVAQTFEDAPGVDGVVAFGVCKRVREGGRRHKEGASSTFRIEKMIKLRTKHCASDACEPRDVDEAELLHGMGYAGQDAKDGRIVHRLMIYHETHSARCHEQRVIINKRTIGEALHPTAWNGTESALHEYNERATLVSGHGSVDVLGLMLM